MSTIQNINSGARLDRLPIAPLHWRILGLVGAGGVLAAMLKERFSTTAQNAVFISSTFLGMLLGSGFAGYLGDRKGRKAAMTLGMWRFVR